MSETETTPSPPPESMPSRPTGAPPAGRPAMEREPRAKGGSELDPDAWMVTFSDLLTLLMTFFVLMFASADPLPPEKLQEAFGQTTGVFSLFRTGFLQRIMVSPRRDISQDLVQVFLNEIGAVNIEVKQDARGLVITLPTDAFFSPGRTELNNKALTRIKQLGGFLKDTRHRIRVEGHTDNTERPRAPIANRWDLSLARANRVLERLTALEIDEDRLELVGYGESRARFPNSSRLGRTRNRRVDIVILNRRNPR